MATFILLGDAVKPRPDERQQDRKMISFSPPWNASTVDTCTLPDVQDWRPQKLIIGKFI
jgi:hypothetical protein